MRVARLPGAEQSVIDVALMLVQRCHPATHPLLSCSSHRAHAAGLDRLLPPPEPDIHPQATGHPLAKRLYSRMPSPLIKRSANGMTPRLSPIRAVIIAHLIAPKI